MIYIQFPYVVNKKSHFIAAQMTDSGREVESAG